MHYDPYRTKLFEMRLSDIYNKYSWLSYEFSLKDFISMFPVVYKRGVPVPPDRPAGGDLDRDVFLEVLVAFRQSFR
ncbi:hypothetical protein ACFSJU_13410 [Paradesertivirga mongoliensis]|uniref:Uncharacterized protein n=1 Tax=Paradesertivirga mongoliensis TaxID=2100740 RepID=A0ABW4ZMR6_9SPHI|nr:hypothetical protein [Pedobacter mongoliensis]